MSEIPEIITQNQHPQVQLLRSSLYSLIQEHSLHEVLDWLRELAGEQSQLESNFSCKKYWGEIEEYLEKATDEALKIANLKYPCGNYWS